jgi:hypothetical protein
LRNAAKRPPLSGEARTPPMRDRGVRAEPQGQEARGVRPWMARAMASGSRYRHDAYSRRADSWSGQAPEPTDVAATAGCGATARESRPRLLRVGVSRTGNEKRINERMDADDDGGRRERTTVGVMVAVPVGAAHRAAIAGSTLPSWRAWHSGPPARCWRNVWPGRPGGGPEHRRERLGVGSAAWPCLVLSCLASPCPASARWSI